MGAQAKTQLIFTVGTNALPIWVAWHHLKDKLDEPIQVRFVHTANTRSQMERLREHCSDADFLDPIQTAAGDPATIRRDIQGILKNPLEDLFFHVHYTGGTKVMSVETVAALEYEIFELDPDGDKGLIVETSYLDPRVEGGPAIVDSNGNSLVQDARKAVRLDLSQIAHLNGFEIGGFPYEYWDTALGGPMERECPPPSKPSQEELASASEALHAGWDIEDPGLLEHGAYAGLETALGRISEKNRSRDNYEIFHSVYVRRSKATDSRVKPFELDVVAMLGYQIVVVSCTLSGKHDMIKQKGMEVILRAQQLGGDEARAIVLCGAHEGYRPLIEAELHHEIGSTDRPLQVWGKDSWHTLPHKFETYLRNVLHWM